MSCGMDTGSKGGGALQPPFRECFGRSTRITSAALTANHIGIAYLEDRERLMSRPGLSFDHRRPQGYETNSRSFLRTSKFSATAVALPQRGSPALRVEHSLPCRRLGLLDEVGATACAARRISDLRGYMAIVSVVRRGPDGPAGSARDPFPNRPQGDARLALTETCRRGGWEQCRSPWSRDRARTGRRARHRGPPADRACC